MGGSSPQLRYFGVFFFVHILKKLDSGWEGGVWPIRVFPRCLDFLKLTRPLSEKTVTSIKLIYFNFHPLDVVSRYSDTQLNDICLIQYQTFNNLDVSTLISFSITLILSANKTN